jgi:hypothetical protein
MLLEAARRIADEVMVALAPQCERIEVAGSIRRLEPEVGDIEIVYESKLRTMQSSLFDGVATEMYPLAFDLIDELVERGVLVYDTDVRRNGPLYKRMVHMASGVVVELFRATCENWGLILALRTGPAEFNKILVAHGWDPGVNGILPPDVAIQGGTVYVRGVARSVPEETDFFRLINVPCWPPHARHPGRLRLAQKAQATLTSFE